MKNKTQFLPLLLIPLFFAAWLWTRTAEAPYNMKHWYKPHRWMSEQFKNKTAIKTTFITVHISETEFYDFDICLEHGELRRIDPPK